MKNKKLLFICRQRLDGYGVSIGLINSAQFVVNSLNNSGIEAKLEMAVDSNDIDRFVTDYNPTHVIIEAIWVVVEKFKELLSMPSHKNRKWIVRIHSKTPFLAQEGIAIDWLKKYSQLNNLILAPNSMALVRDLNFGLKLKNIEYLPNIYEPNKTKGFLSDIMERINPSAPEINIGCLGAIRPLKNHLEQAIGAMIFANEINKKLRFHINGNRIESRGEECLKNLKALFAESTHELIEHSWLPHEEFINLIKTMDLGLQVSFSESFNIVAADFAANDIPIIVSPDIEWSDPCFMANPNSAIDISKALYNVWLWKQAGFNYSNKPSLDLHNKHAKKIWYEFIIK